MDFELSEQQKIIVEQIRRFVREEIVPLEDKLDPDASELPAQDFDTVEIFYREVFGWRFTDYGPEYRAFSNGRLEGGFYRAKTRSTTAKGGALVVIYTRHLERARQRVIKSGGEIVKDIFAFPGGRRFQFTDPHGNELAVWSNAATTPADMGEPATGVSLAVAKGLYGTWLGDTSLANMAALPADFDPELVMDDLHDLLARCHRFGDGLAGGLFLYGFHEIARHRQRNIGLQKRDPHLAKRGLDVVLRQRALFGKPVEDAREAV